MGWMCVYIADADGVVVGVGGTMDSNTCGYNIHPFFFCVRYSVFILYNREPTVDMLYKQRNKKEKSFFINL